MIARTAILAAALLAASPAAAMAVPAPSFTFDQPVVAGEAVTFDASGSLCDRPPCQFRWYHPEEFDTADGTADQAASFTYGHVDAPDERHAVTLTVSNRWGRSASTVRAFQVLAQPDPEPSPSPEPTPSPPPSDATTITDTVDGWPVSHTFAEPPGRTNTGPLTPLSSGAPCGQIDSGSYVLTDRDITCRIYLPPSSTAVVDISQSVMHACAQNQIIGQGGTVRLTHDSIDQRACNDEPAVVIERLGYLRYSTVVRSSNPIRVQGAGVIVDGNWFHDFQAAQQDAHTDGIEVYGGTGATVSNNFWSDVAGVAATNSTIFVQVNGAGGNNPACCAGTTIRGNTIPTGGSYPLFLAGGGTSCGVGPVDVIDNRWVSTLAWPNGGWAAMFTEGCTTPGFGVFTGNRVLVQRTGQTCNVVQSNPWPVLTSGSSACANGAA